MLNFCDKTAMLVIKFDLIDVSGSFMSQELVDQGKNAEQAELKLCHNMSLILSVNQENLQ